MQFQEFYKTFIPEFQNAYKECIQKCSPSSLYEPVHYTLKNPGKQIRPALLVSIAQTFSDITLVACLPAACCIEMIHNFTLVHDDIMDNDLLRHGQKTVNAKWNNNKAILSGDALFALALQQLDHYKNNPELYAMLLPELLHAVIIVCEGQAEDMDFEDRDDVSLSEYLQMVDKKTAHLLSVSAKMGAIIGNASQTEIQIIEKIIKELGVVFQIQDDLLELTSSSETMGKSLGSDLIKEKKTFPYLFAKQELPQEVWKKFINYIDNDFIRLHGIEPAKALLKDNFIFDRIHELIKLRHVTIQQLIKELPERSWELINSMVDFIMNRKN